MSRSIHDTWGVLKRAERAERANAEVPRAIAVELRRNCFRQTMIRDSERRTRRRGATPPQPVHPDHLSILVDDHAPHVFHPANEEDIRAILRRLPPGSLDGLQAVRLCVDHEEARREPRVLDPFTGRPRREAIPGVFASSTQGDYDRHTGTIRLFAYLCDPAALGPFAPYFKMATLRTLVHETAHHFDLTFRVGRSRWDLADKKKKEAWAYRAEDAQTARIVLPYVRERYPLECDELTRWIKDHGGVTLPAQFILEENDTGCTPEDAFLALVRLLLEGKDRDAARVAFARELHWIGDNKRALKVVRKVLERHRDDAGALAVSACLTQCEAEDYEAGESLCRRAITADPTCVDAWAVMARGYAKQLKWDQAALACEQGLSLVPDGGAGGWYFLETLARSHLCLDRWVDVDSDVARMRAWGTEQASLAADVYLAIARCWREQWQSALLLASRLLSAGEHDKWRLLLAAVRFECAHRLGQPYQGRAFTKAELVKLARYKFAKTWGQRIRNHIEMRA